MRHIQGLNIVERLEDLCDRNKLGLLVYDMQIGVCRQVADAPAIIERVARVLQAARAAGVRVVFTRHMSLSRQWMGG